MIEEKIFFKKRVSFQKVLTLLANAVLDCRKNKNFDGRELAIWNANICSCSHRNEQSLSVEIPYGIETMDSLLVLGIINISNYGKISIIINQPRELNVVSYVMPYDTEILGILFEGDDYSQDSNKSVLSAMYNSLANCSC